MYYTVQKSINRKKEAPDNLNYLKRVEIKLDYEWSNRTLGDVIQNKASINFFNVEKQVQKEFLAVLKQRLGSSYAILKHKLFNDLFYIEYRKLGLAN
ncbi:hypothetical protein NX772_02910 [Mesomycoplasma molare]|uniref:Uncharacterized protein n=1 Tax=Mesomycoplasma molare TaxID=171288 RepID=A0ABY5TWS3_9BACT|nr:hypothetical protein [Mesomycoplasma molare]UWD34031.1 hypothetical protein NX772_02910 [Mesomycoplasma molare]